MRRSILIALMVLASAGAFAQDSEKIKDAVSPAPSPKAVDEKPQTTLKPILVTSERGNERPVFEVPQSIFVLNKEQIWSGPLPANVPDLLSQSPSVHAQATAPGQGSPFIRGLTSRRNILMVDGIRINNSVFRNGPNQYTATIDPYILERAEIISGSRSLLFGSDALGGVIRLESRMPGSPTKTLFQAAPAIEEEDDQEPDPTKAWVRGEFLSRYASADQSTTSRVSIRGQSGRLGFIGGFTYQDFNEIKSGKHVGTLPNTDYSQRSADLKLVYQVSKKVDVVVAYQRTDQRNVPRTHSTLFSKSYRGTTIPGDPRRDLDQSRQLAYLQYKVYDKGFIDQGRFSVSWQRQYENEDRLRTRNRTSRQGFSVDSFGAFLELSSTVVPDIDLVLRYGVDYDHDFVDTFRSDTNTAGVISRRSRGGFADDAQYDLFGLYAMVEAPIGDSLTLNGGLRYEYAHVNADDVDPAPNDTSVLRKIDRSYDGLISSFGVTIHAHEYLNLITSISQGFRAPNLDDTTAFNDVQSGALDTPAPDLDPETTISFEAGFKFDHPRFGNFQFFYFLTELDEFIARVPTGATVNGLNVFTRDNFSDGRIEGVEGGGEIFLFTDPFISVYGGFAWTYGVGESLVNGQKRQAPLSRINPAQGRVGLRWRSSNRRYYLEAEGFFVRHQSRLAPSDVGDTQRIPVNGTPGYALYAVRAGVELAPGLRLSAAAQNLLNKDYRVHGSGSNGPGLNVILGLRGEF
jgi:hemoglobin/transferrin/lactoferrin receptor protein